MDKAVFSSTGSSMACWPAASPKQQYCCHRPLKKTRRPQTVGRTKSLRVAAAQQSITAASTDQQMHEISQSPCQLQSPPSRRQLLQSAGLAAMLPGCIAAMPAQAQSGPFCLTGQAQSAVADAFRAVAEKGKGPVLLRLAFHDAATFSKAGGSNGGANASIRFELDRPENAGLKRGWRVVEAAAARLKGTDAEGLVSMADLIALGGAHAVQICGGPSISVPVGRKDAASADPGGRLPAESLSARDLKAAFADKGLSTHDLVVLSGAHTLGGKGFGDPLTFDGTYYKTLLKKPWADPTAEMGKMIGLPSDHVLPEDDECLRIIEGFAADSDKFYEAFVPAYVQLTCLGADWR